jgi:hypothetical protein
MHGPVAAKDIEGVTFTRAKVKIWTVEAPGRTAPIVKHIAFFLLLSR